MTTIKDLKDFFAGKYDDVKVFEPTMSRNIWEECFQCDRIKAVDKYVDTMKINNFELFGEEEYNRATAICYDSYVDFESLYGKKDAVVLCILLENRFNFDEEDRFHFTMRMMNFRR